MVRDNLKIFLVLNILFILIVITNFIPNSAIYTNLCKSVAYYNGLQADFESYGAEPGGDMNELNLIMCVDSSRPLYSALSNVMYGETGHFQDDKNGYASILEKKEPDNDYNRYWHGYQVFYRPLLVFFNAKQIMLLFKIVYLVLLMILFIRYIRCNPPLIISFGLMNILYILPTGFHSITYISIYFIMLLGIYFIQYTNYSVSFIFGLLGMLTTFFDLLTVETLTLTIPLLFLIIKYYKTKTFVLSDYFVGCLLWLFWYAFTYVYKWILTSIYLKQNVFYKAIAEITKYKSLHTSIESVKINMNKFAFHILSYNTVFTLFITLFLLLCVVLYLFRKKGTEIYLGCALFTALIPYIRYIVLSGHSYEHSYFEFKAQSVVIPAVVILFYIGLFDNVNLLKKRKIKKGGVL